MIGSPRPANLPSAGLSATDAKETAAASASRTHSG